MEGKRGREVAIPASTTYVSDPISELTATPCTRDPRGRHALQSQPKFPIHRIVTKESGGVLSRYVLGAVC